MIKTELPSVTISGLALSDLFFGAGHPYYEEACNDFDPETTDTTNGEYDMVTRAALLKDAVEFIDHLGIKEVVTPEMLTENFYERL